MNYSVVLYFDSETDNKISSIIRLIVDNGVNDYLISNKVPPHITIADFDCKNIIPIINSLEKNKENIKQNHISLASIGLFNPSLLFLAPVVNQFLLTTCEMVNNLINSFSDTKMNAYYMPYQWVPHVTIAANLSPKEILTALLAAHYNFKAFEGYVTKLAIVQNKPRADLKVWDLQV